MFANSDPPGGTSTTNANSYGGGAGGIDTTFAGGLANGGQGFIRIIWPGNIRSFPYLSGK
jgi:hypothetical protein